jgi:hypothetical protein
MLDSSADLEITNYDRAPVAPTIISALPQEGVNAVGNSEDAVIALVESITKYEEEKEKEEYEREISEFLRQTPENLIQLHYNEYEILIPCKYRGDSRLKDVVDAAERLCEEGILRIAELDRQREEERELVKLGEELCEWHDSIEQEKAAAAWLSRQDLVVQERHSRGFLPMTSCEIKNALRDEFFAPLNERKRYERMKNGDVCTCEYDACTVKFETRATSHLTEEEYLTFKEFESFCIEKLARDNGLVFRITPRDHTGTSETCENEVARTGLLVEARWGGHTFSREYAL